MFICFDSPETARRTSIKLGTIDYHPMVSIMKRFWTSCLRHNQIFFNLHYLTEDRRDGVVARASASQSVDLGFIPFVELYQKTLKNGIHSFPAWRSAFSEGYGEQAGKLACCVLGQDT